MEGGLSREGSRLKSNRWRRMWKRWKRKGVVEIDIDHHRHKLLECIREGIQDLFKNHPQDMTEVNNCLLTCITCNLFFVYWSVLIFKIRQDAIQHIATTKCLFRFAFSHLPKQLFSMWATFCPHFMMSGQSKTIGKFAWTLVRCWLRYSVMKNVQGISIMSIIRLLVSRDSRCLMFNSNHNSVNVFGMQHIIVMYVALLYFYAPRTNDWGHIIFSCLFVCLFVCCQL